MLRGFIKACFLTASVSSVSLHAGDTITLTYDQTPVRFQEASTPTAVGAVYLDISWRFMESYDSIAGYLSARDSRQYQALRKQIALVGFNSKDPNDILAHVKNAQFKADYVRLVMGCMAKNFVGIRTPSIVRLVFNAAGYLSYLQCKGFAVTDDGFTLTESVMLPMKIHRSMFREYGI